MTWAGERCPSASPATGVYTFAGRQGDLPFFGIAWVDLDRFSCEGARYTFEALLFADGRIVLQYRNLQGLLSSATGD